jgi:hypothetical protein
MAEPDVAEVALRRTGQAVEFAAHLIERLRRRALKREDRLLLVADGVDRAPPCLCAFAGKKFRDQRPHDRPLFRAGVLRLVDQHVVDAAVELVVHPGRGDALQQRQRLVDQVVVVQETAPVLFGAIAREHGVRDGDQRRAAVAGCNRAAAGDQRADALLLGQ